MFYKIFIAAMWILPFVCGEVCSPRDHAKITTNCDVLAGAPLNIRNGDDYNRLAEKLQGVREIHNGVLIENTDLERFDMLAEVDIISNPSGPALIFKRNTKLKRIIFGSLRKLTSPDHTVRFEDDNFPLEAYDNSESLDDLFHLEYATRRGRNESNSECTASFLQILTSKEKDKMKWLVWILGSVAAIALGCDLILAVILFMTHKKNKEMDEKVEEEVVKPMEKPEDITKEPEELEDNGEI